MKSALTVLAGGLALALASQASAQTCASPVEIFSNSTVAVDTCSTGNDLPVMGGTSSAPNDYVFFFDAASANANIDVASSVSGAVAYLMPACTTATDPTAFGFAGFPLAVNSSNSPDGSTMYINVTFDGTLPASTCGEVTLTVDGTLPVELETFSVM